VSFFLFNILIKAKIIKSVILFEIKLRFSALFSDLKRNCYYEYFYLTDTCDFCIAAAPTTTFILKTTSCLSDFDPFDNRALDWTEFESNVRVYAIGGQARFTLLSEFKMFGEALTEDLILTDGPKPLLVSLMHECHKLLDKADPSVERARRYECHVNTYDLSPVEHHSDKSSLRLFSLSEFLTMEQFHHANVLIDVRCFFDSQLLLVYSKQGTANKKNVAYESEIHNYKGN